MKRGAATRGFSAIELSAGFAVAGSLLAIAIPAFVHQLTSSRFVEPTRGLLALASGAVGYAAAHGGFRGSPSVALAFPRSAGLTPAVPPRGHLVADPDGTWNDATWVALRFPGADDDVLLGPDDPHAFSFAFDSNLASQRSTFVAHAHGDLDGDGTTSTFEVRGHATPADGAVIEPGMYVESPLE